MECRVNPCPVQCRMSQGSVFSGIGSQRLKSVPKRCSLDDQGFYSNENVTTMAELTDECLGMEPQGVYKARAFVFPSIHICTRIQLALVVHGFNGFEERSLIMAKLMTKLWRNLTHPLVCLF